MLFFQAQCLWPIKHKEYLQIVVFILVEHLICARSGSNRFQMLICVIVITNLSGGNYDYSHFTDEKKQGTLDKLAGIRMGSECWSWGLNQGVSLLTSQAPAYCTIALCHPGFKGQGGAHSRLTSEDNERPNHWAALSVYRMNAISFLLFNGDRITTS